MRILSCTRLRSVPDLVVGSFFDDLHVVDVGFAHPGGGDLHELHPGAHRVDVLAAAVAHARAHSTHELLDHAHHRTLVRHPALDALGNELVGMHRGVLEIAVGGALLHSR